MSNQEIETKLILCPNCGHRFETSVADDIHTTVSLNRPTNSSIEYVGTTHECEDCHSITTLYWTRGRKLGQTKVTPEQRAALFRHWNRLSQNVFIPLRDFRLHNLATYGGGSQRADFKCYFDMSRIISSPYFEDASEHLNIDLPIYLMQLDVIKADVENLNSKVDKFWSDFENSLQLELSLIAPSNSEIVESNSTYLHNSVTLIAGYWFRPVIAYLQEGNRQSLDTLIQGLEDFRLSPRNPNQVPPLLSIDGVPAAHLPSGEDDRQAIEIINRYAHDRRLIRRILRYSREKRALENTLKSELPLLIDRKVIHPIRDEQYRTLAPCCERVLSSIKIPRQR